MRPACLSALLAVAASLLLSACAPTTLNAYHRHPTLAASVATNDAEVARQRFGDYTRMPGSVWVAQSGDMMLWMQVNWVVPGASMYWRQDVCTKSECHPWPVLHLIQYDPRIKELHVSIERRDGTTSWIRHEEVRDDGSVGAYNIRFRYDAASDTVRASFLTHENVYRRITRAEFDAGYAEKNRNASEEARRERQRSTAFWDNLNSGMQSVNRGLAEASSQQQSQRRQETQAPTTSLAPSPARTTGPAPTPSAAKPAVASVQPVASVNKPAPFTPSEGPNCRWEKTGWQRSTDEIGDTEGEVRGRIQARSSPDNACEVRVTKCWPERALFAKGTTRLLDKPRAIVQCSTEMDCRRQVCVQPPSKNPNPNPGASRQ
jgi:hypothetical protein